MKPYTVKDVAKMLELSSAQVRSFAKSDWLRPTRGKRGELRFSFQDLVLLRTAKELVASDVPPKRVHRVLDALSRELPEGRPLSGMQIRAQNGQLVVRRGETLWNAESGQAHFDFEVDQLAEIATPQLQGMVDDERDFEDELDAEDWYGVGLDLEVAAPEHARDAYRRALELDPDHVDARINLGRLLLESEQFSAAEANFRNVILRFPNNALAHYNLGVCLEDQGGNKEAMEAYRAAIHSDPACADAYYNLSQLLEQSGDAQGAIRALQSYRKLRNDS